MASKRGLYANIHAKKKRIAAGSGEKMRKPGAPGAPTNANFKRAAKTAKKRKQQLRPFIPHGTHDDSSMERGLGIQEKTMKVTFVYRGVTYTRVIGQAILGGSSPPISIWLLPSKEDTISRIYGGIDHKRDSLT